MSIYNIFSFIEKANIIHNFKYDYSQIDYKNTRCKISIICPIHGMFIQAAYKHLQKHGCPQCGIKSRIEKRIKGNDVFIIEAQRKHLNLDGTPKYDYSKVNYQNSANKVTIRCHCHGEFRQVANSHLLGNGCPKCGRNTASINNRHTQDEILKKFKSIHSSNQYTYDNVNYQTGTTKVVITCSKHGDFKQTPHNHLAGHGCPNCRDEYLSYKYKKDVSEFIQAAKIKHQISNVSPKFLYDNVIYKGNKIPVKIFCNASNHGYFTQKPNAHLNGQGCPKCDSSKGENIIRNYLHSHNISFTEQYRFAGCKDKRTLPFDFIIEKEGENCAVIEFQGLQHFIPIEYFGGTNSLKSQIRRDKIKRAFCKKNNLLLLEISYKDIDKISILLDSFINTIQKDKNNVHN